MQRPARSKDASTELSVVHGLDAELYADIEEQINHDTEIIPEMDQSGGNETFTVNDHDISIL